MEKIYSLRSEKDFQDLFKRGRRIEGKLFTMRFKRNELSHGRFAFIVSKKTAKSAVKRNRLRRRAREWVRNKSNLMNLALDFAFIFKKDALDSKRKKFYEELKEETRKINA